MAKRRDKTEKVNKTIDKFTSVEMDLEWNLRNQVFPPAVVSNGWLHSRMQSILSQKLPSHS